MKCIVKCRYSVTDWQLLIIPLAQNKNANKETIFLICFMVWWLDSARMESYIWSSKDNKMEKIKRLKWIVVTESQPSLGERVAQWWEHSLSINVARVRIPEATPYVAWVCSWFSPCSEMFFTGYSGFSQSSKTPKTKTHFVDVLPG